MRTPAPQLQPSRQGSDINTVRAGKSIFSCSTVAPTSTGSAFADWAEKPLRNSKSMETHGRHDRASCRWSGGWDISVGASPPPAPATGAGCDKLGKKVASPVKNCGSMGSSFGKARPRFTCESRPVPRRALSCLQARQYGRRVWRLQSAIRIPTQREEEQPQPNHVQQPHRASRSPHKSARARSRRGAQCLGG
jgi:hypothetical protein